MGNIQDHQPESPYHARYIAMLLARWYHDVGRLLPALFSANLDLHPHQIDAAVFASRSVYRDGVILADEEGLGKTIEAGIVLLLQASLEGNRRLLVLCPPTLVDHWRKELVDKFSLSTFDLDDLERETGDEETGVVVLPYGEAYRNAERLASVSWDWVVLDEAHRLANAGLSDPIQAETIRTALKGRRKPLLTATPTPRPYFPRMMVKRPNSAGLWLALMPLARVRQS